MEVGEETSLRAAILLLCRRRTERGGKHDSAATIGTGVDRKQLVHQQKKSSLGAKQWLRPEPSIAPLASVSPLPPIHGLSILVAPRSLRSNTTWIQYTCCIRRVNSAPGTPGDTLGISLSKVSIGRQTRTLQISSAVLYIPLYSAEVFRE